MGRVKKSKGLEETSCENSSKSAKVKTCPQSDESENECNIKPKNQKSFAALQLDDSLSESEPLDEAPKLKQTSKDNKKPQKSCEDEKKADEPKKGNRKSKKSKRNKHDSDDEELQTMLAELELEYSGGHVPQANKTDNNQSEENKDSCKEKSLPQNVSQESVEKDTHKKKGKNKQKSVVNKSVVDSTSDGNSHSNQCTKSESHNSIQNEEEQGKKKTKVIKENTESQKKASKGIVLEDAEKHQAIAQSEEQDDKKKKKKGSKDKPEKESKDTKKGPGKKTIAAMQEALKKMKEQEEKAKQEEEERLRKEEELEEARLEAIRLEQERKEKKKQKEKERKERLKAEGKLLTAKQKADRARAINLIESLKAQGVEFPEAGVKKPRPGTRVKQSKPQKEQDTVIEEKTSENIEQFSDETPQVEGDIDDKNDKEETPLETNDVKDAWDVSSDDESEETTDSHAPKVEEEAKTNSDEESSSDNPKSDTDDDSSSEEGEDDRSPAEKNKERVLDRIMMRREAAEKKKDPNNLRAAVVCVLGHVDTGKTKILDKLRRTNVQDGEAGGITQQIGATNVPIDAIKEQIKIVKGANEIELKLPGLLIIDTPGHESFTNLRNRGSSLCDLAILVVDIMHGLEPQTIESINILKEKKTPFIVALNKIDRLYDWQTMNRKDVRDIIKSQAPNTILEFERRAKEVIVQFAEQGLNAALFYENPDPRTYVSLVPTSAITGEGMGNLLALIIEFSQLKLQKRLMYSEELQATVLEVKAISGLGTTIDVILVNGLLREGDTIICAGTDGPIVTQIRSLLMPQPLKELRVKSAYIEHKEVQAAQGVKIAAKDLEKAIAGLNLYVAQKPDEIEVLKEEITRELKSALSGIKLQERGVYVQASTLGSLEALLEFLRSSKIPFCGIRIGPVVKKDVMKASIMLEHDSQYATILAFDVKIERDAQELADSLGVKIFQADIIYHLFDKFMAYREELKQRKREEYKNIAVFPCKIRVLPQFVFNSRDPIVCGVMVEAGVLKEGTPICVPSKEFLELGHITSVEINHKPVENARKGQEVCIKIEPIPGESPKMFGRHFDETDMLVSKISRQSIDACKEYFRDDLLKTDWQLMVELKKIFQIL